MPTPEKNKPILPVHADSGLRSRFEAITDELAQVRVRISEQLTTSSEPINTLIRHLSGGGKMLRPALVLLAGKSCGLITEPHINIGAIVELIHTATLLHDDVIDGAQSRRSAATVNALCGNESAVLLGDFILSKVFVMFGRLETANLREVLSDTAVRICHGELLQNIHRQKQQLGEGKYFEIVNDKTAALFSCCCYLGGLVAACGAKQLAGLSDYGRNLGMAFQVTDDLLDIIGDEAREGKTLGTDFAKRKLTLPFIHLFSRVLPAEKARLIELCSDNEHQQLIEVLEKAGSIAYTQAVAEKFCHEAIKCLKPLDDSEARDALVGIAEFVARRCVW